MNQNAKHVVYRYYPSFIIYAYNYNILKHEFI